MSAIIQELDQTDDMVSYCELLKQLTSIDPDKITKEEFISHLQLIKSNPLHKIFVAKLNGKIIGTTTVLIEPKFIHNLSRVSHIEDVVVDSNYRSYGIGKLLINKAITISKELGCYKIILDCSAKNIGFYQKIGFVDKEHHMALYVD